MFTIIDYGVGNLISVGNMLKKAGVSAIISGDEKDITAATKLVLPGMGHFDSCMQALNKSGLRTIIEQKVLQEKTPVLGICIGLQMLMGSSEEGNEKGLGWIDGRTIRFKPEQMKEMQKVPNMGWLDIQNKKQSRLLEGLQDARFYFAHSYHVTVANVADELIAAHYGYDFTAAIERENIIGVQFHPEKSHRFGMQLLKNFATLY